MSSKKDTQKKRSILPFLILVLLLLIPAGFFAFSFFGTLKPHTVIGEESIAYVHVPNLLRTANRLLEHQTLDTLLADPALLSVAPAVNTLRHSGLFSNPLIRFAAGGSLDLALYPDSHYLAAYDTARLSSLLFLAPAILPRFSIKNLYYVQAGRYSRFEYRGSDQDTVYIAIKRNLIVVSNSERLIEPVLDESGIKNDGSRQPAFAAKNFDAALLLRSESILAGLADDAPDIRTILERLNTSGQAEASVYIQKDQIDLNIRMPISSPLPAITKLIDADSTVPSMLYGLPPESQYATILSPGSLRDLLDAAIAIQGNQAVRLLEKADASSRFLTGLSLEELIFSWTGNELAIFGLEGRPRPVFAVKIADENRRKQVFESLLSSFALTGDNTVILDGTRIPRLMLPDFLTALLSLWKIQVPSPYYLTERGFLYLSESPENLLETVNAIRQNTSIVKTEVWKKLATHSPDASTITLFYSLDRSVPFFLRGTDTVQRILQLYGQGLARLSLRDGETGISLAIKSVSTKGPLPLSGYPLKPEGKLSPEIEVLLFPAKGEVRILFTENGNRLVSLNPVNGTRTTYESPEPLWFVLSEGIERTDLSQPAVWVVSQQGTVALLDGNLKNQEGFPVATGNRLSAPPAAFGGSLYISDMESSLYIIDRFAKTHTLSLPFQDILRAAPSFMRQGSNIYMAAYPKGFFSELWLTDEKGTVRPGWPVSASGIAFGSPLLFHSGRTDTGLAFLTQAGELSVYSESGTMRETFPLQLPGVFFIQPVFDGKALWSLASDGRLFKTGLDGTTESVQLEGITAETGYLATADIDGDKVPEVLASGEANLLYAVRHDLTMLPGFPLPVWGKPWTGDLNGDGKTDIISGGMDNLIYGWHIR